MKNANSPAKRGKRRPHDRQHISVDDDGPFWYVVASDIGLEARLIRYHMVILEAMLTFLGRDVI